MKTVFFSALTIAAGLALAIGLVQSPPLYALIAWAGCFGLAWAANYGGHGRGYREGRDDGDTDGYYRGWRAGYGRGAEDEQHKAPGLGEHVSLPVGWRQVVLGAITDDGAVYRRFDRSKSPRYGRHIEPVREENCHRGAQ